MAEKLYAYQDEAVERIAMSDVDIYLADDAGLGKSKIALDVAKKRGVQRLLIVCPLSVVYAWRRELTKWWPEAAKGAVKVFIIPYSHFSKPGDDVVKAIKADVAMDLTILDEAHFLKSIEARRTRIVLGRLRPKLGRVLPMSATPAPNHAGELYAILRTVRPDLIPSRREKGKPMRPEEFDETFVEHKMVRVSESRLVDTIVGTKNGKTLRDMTRSFFLRRTKAQVLKQLPPLHFVVTPIQVREPEGFRGILCDDDRLLALCAGSNPIATVYRQLGEAKVPAAVEWINDWLEGNRGRQLVVWAVHHSVIDEVYRGTLDHSPVKLDGRDTTIHRGQAVEWFLSGKARLFIGQIQAGGTGLTLIGPDTRCADVVFVESSPTPTENYQAACRVHRIGQWDAVLARFLSAAGTFDDRLQAIQERKMRDFTELFDSEEKRV
jgi:SWI/SNF-related matrix-associated actin-dependent regulator of chromatin subfamily A-like protein 1